MISQGSELDLHFAGLTGLELLVLQSAAAAERLDSCRA